MAYKNILALFGKPATDTILVERACELAAEDGARVTFLHINEHDAGHLFAAVVINLIALVMKFGDRTHIGATHLATSMVAMLQLLAASFVWMWHVNISQLAMNGETMSTIVSLSGGALVANLISVVQLIGETLRQTR